MSHGRMVLLGDGTYGQPISRYMSTYLHVDL